MKYYHQPIFLLGMLLLAFGSVQASEKDKKAKKAFFSFAHASSEVNGSVNSEFRENGPLVTLDGQTMFFSRSLHPDNVGGESDFEDIWYSQWNEEKEAWDEAVRFPFFNNEFPNFINSVAIDNGVPTVVLGNDYSNPKKIKEGLSYSRFVNNQWTNPVKYEIENFVNFSERVDYFVNEDASILLFSGVMDYNRYDRQIYISEKINESTWSTPVELAAVNTDGDDIAPYMVDNKYLFFSSDSLGGYGGKDIFVMQRLNQLGWDKWTEPINLGPLVNDENDNVYFHYSKVRNMAYLTKGTHEDDMDIVQIKLFLEEEIFAHLNGKSGCTARSFYENRFDSDVSTHESQKCFDYQVVEMDRLDTEDKSFIWHFGDETIGYGISTEHCYNEPGTYMVNFSIVENKTQFQFDDEYNFQVEIFDDMKLVLDEIHQAGRSLNHKAYTAGILNLPKEVVEVTYYWNFGDGNYGCGTSVEHDYIYGETFKVTVTAVFELEDETIQLTKSIETKVDPTL